MRGGEQVEGDAQALLGIQGLFRIQRYHHGGPVPAQSHRLFPHPSAHRRLGSGTSQSAHKAHTIPLVEISSTPRSESPLARSKSYTSLDRSFARIVCAWVCICLHAQTQTQFLTCVCVRLRACLRADLIKTQNTFAHKIVQNSNTLWVQKL